MPIELHIDDGNPWYLSPNIWVVPNDDPNGIPGQPIENSPAYVWCRVRNRGDLPVTGAAVRYYWADPSTAITRTSAHLIGQSSVSLAADETRDVLCVTTWIPQYVNSGHECLLAEAFHASDPLPPHSPSDPFNVPSDRHVAQRNISVIGAAANMRILSYPFLAGNAKRFRSREVLVRARQVNLDLLEPMQWTLGLRELPTETVETTFGLQPYRCGEMLRESGEHELMLQLDESRQMGLALTLPNPGLDPGQGVLYLVEQIVGDDVVGGVAALFIAQEMVSDR